MKKLLVLVGLMGMVGVAKADTGSQRFEAFKVKFMKKEHPNIAEVDLSQAIRQAYAKEKVQELEKMVGPADKYHEVVKKLEAAAEKEAAKPEVVAKHAAVLARMQHAGAKPVMFKVPVKK